ncbi:TATA element modulatory factor isoform X1 [Schistocerca americana]|uniref:TATA element modulatory factor isoform X1 n=1 Tax=Schistocerca americana TaxID=7009 RepID=UPI001F4F4D61|nr:TATA element modulatory factor isoform X1 [Schistocerca americana]XP_046994566.1 TATA element modulatory factor isoform X1 [Schistocerca americana]
MSWFDASGIASLAKNALKEAQKTIDKALDIKEDEQHPETRDPTLEAASDDFFATWGLKSGVDTLPTDKPSDTDISSQKESPKGNSKLNMTASLWGSFTGSFFENPRTSEANAGVYGDESSDPVSLQPKKGGLIRTSSLKHDSRNKDASIAAKKRKKSWDEGGVLSYMDSDETSALCDDPSELRSNEGFSRSKLVVESEDTDADAECCAVDHKVVTVGQSTDDGDENAVVVTHRRELPSTGSFKHNRLSVISSESDKKSSESVEVIGSECGSSFTTSPESELGLMSPDMSVSSSVTGVRSCAATSSPESVEVIPDTTSSVEVLGDPCSGRTSRTTSSPYISPESAVAPCSYEEAFGELQTPVEMPQTRSGDTSEKTSPESVEVIPEEDDESVADDSYTSASESTATATVTIMEASGGRQFPQAVIQSQPIGDSGLLGASRTEAPPEIPVATHTGCRAGLQLALAHTTEPIRIPVSVSADIPKPSVVLPATPSLKDKVVEATSAAEDGSSGSTLSDSRTLMSTDSSGDATLMDSSIEESTPSAPITQQQSSSYYVKTMLADAMGEEENRTSLVTRDQSPISSESRSDLVKVESEQTSGHTSGDELETTTSSDIEIISSPNGDSSSTHSRHSPAKLLQRATRGKLALAVAEHECSSSHGSESKFSVIPKTKGHQRELSETSSGGSDDSHCQEVEKLLKRVADMTEILESRESKLIEISRLNIELEEHNTDLKRQLETALQSSVSESQDIHQVTEEYTQRLSSLERKFQQAIRDKETLRKQLEQARLDAASRLSKTELEGLVAEKDEVIRELREEGEKLSKQQLQYSNIIKKLRVKEKESDNTIKNQKEQLEELSQEVERLKRSLTAKEEVERTQIEAVHQLTARTKNQEKEIAALHSQIDDLNQKVETLSVSLEAASKEMNESKKALALKEEQLAKAMESIENMAQQELEAALEEAKRNSQEQQQHLNATIEDLRQRLRQTEEEHSGREASLRQETAELLRRLEAAEARSEELAEAASGATRPLLRQLEQLQATAASRQATFEKQEKSLTDTIGELQGRMSALTEQERMSREQNISLHSQVSSLEHRLSSANAEIAQLQDDLSCQRKLYLELREERDKEHRTSESMQETLAEEMKDLQRQINSLEQQLSVERAATEAEKRKTAMLQDQLRDRDIAVEKERSGGRGSSPAGTPRSSPTLSFGRMSLSESVSSVTWPQFPDEAFDTASNSGRLSNVYDSLRSGNTTSLLEGLQAQLKLRDGEVQQLQWELSRRDAERAALTGEVSALIARIEEQETALASAQELRAQFEDIQHKYDALLQMYGEKVEETQELKLDLQDVKEMYKTQIDQLLKKESPS